MNVCILPKLKPHKVISGCWYFEGATKYKIMRRDFISGIKYTCYPKVDGKYISFNKKKDAIDFIENMYINDFVK